MGCSSADEIAPADAMAIVVALLGLLTPAVGFRFASRGASHCDHRSHSPHMLFDSLFGKAEPAFTAGESNEAMRKRYLEVGIQIPLYEVLREGDGWEVRRYQPLAVAECDYDKRPEGYELLGGYAGGENEFGISMPRTAPCVMQPSREPKRMMWVLPTPHTPLDGVGEPAPPPKPQADDLVATRVLPPLVVGVARFSGYAVPDVVYDSAGALAKALVANGVKLAPGAAADLMLAQYNELFSLPWQRDNEVWLRVDLDG